MNLVSNQEMPETLVVEGHEFKRCALKPVLSEAHWWQDTDDSGDPIGEPVWIEAVWHNQYLLATCPIHGDSHGPYVSVSWPTAIDKQDTELDVKSILDARLYQATLTLKHILTNHINLNAP